ncbi:MAG: hypothetical protein HY360_15685 [Verrucomicrobia bacterium]|nr:hypothetical protein [Verrucomicrobiota bacterium]
MNQFFVARPGRTRLRNCISRPVDYVAGMLLRVNKIEVGSLARSRREKVEARRRLRRLSPYAAQQMADRVLLPKWWQNVSRSAWVEDLA